MSNEVKINLTIDQTAVLLRCLSYGQSAISRAEHKAGIGEVIETRVESMRRLVTATLANHLIAQAASPK